MPKTGSRLGTLRRRLEFLDHLKTLGDGDDCVLWPFSSGSPDGTPYARTYDADGRRVGAHVWVFEHIHGPLETALTKDGRKVGVLHHCDNPPCVRPSHLFKGEALENLSDAARKGRMGRHSRIAVSEADLAVIRRLLDHRVPQTTIAAAFGISQQTVSRIKRGVLWREGKHFDG